VRLELNYIEILKLAPRAGLAHARATRSVARLDGEQAKSQTERTREVWLAALDDFRNWLIREAA
jgi:hypothetical protein